MKNKRSVAIIDVRILDTFEGAEFVRDLEPKMNLIFAVEDPRAETPETMQALESTNATVVSNTGSLNSQDFVSAVFEFVDNGHNEIVAVGAHYQHWQLVNQANKNSVPFGFVYNPSNKRMVWL